MNRPILRRCGAIKLATGQDCGSCHREGAERSDPLGATKLAELEKLIEAWAQSSPRATKHTRLETIAGHLMEGAAVPGCTCLKCAVLRLGGSEQDVAGAVRVVKIIVGADPLDREELAEAIRCDSRWVLPPARTLARYATVATRAAAGIEIQLPPPVIRRYEGSGNESLPIESARQIPILSLLDWLGIEGVRKAGREYIALCPFHDDSRPSFRIDAKRGLWYCDPCSMGGDAIDLVMRMRGSSFPDAVNEMVAR